MKRLLILLFPCFFSFVKAQEFVDLGLSVDWCDVNLGAVSPTQAGELYAWGETDSREKFSLENYKYKDPENEQWTLDIGKNISGTSYDPAYQLNEEWRLPTQKEFLELCEKCSWRWIDDGQAVGYKITGPNGNEIFMSVGGLDSFGNVADRSGNYWSGTLSKGFGRSAVCLLFDDERYATAGTYKAYGKLIRPVRPNLNYLSSQRVSSEWADPKYADVIKNIDAENYEDAFNEATMLAASGDPKVQCLLAAMYMCGAGTLRNYESAQELLTQAAQQGYSRGEYMLGGFGSLEKSHEFTKMLVGDDEELLYANDNIFWYQMLSSDTTPETFKEAFDWFCLDDGKWGYRDIMYYAGIVLIRGDYGYQNPETGLQWIVKSARLGYNDAIELLHQIMASENEE